MTFLIVLSLTAYIFLSLVIAYHKYTTSDKDYYTGTEKNPYYGNFKKSLLYGFTVLPKTILMCAVIGMVVAVIYIGIIEFVLMVWSNIPVKD